MVKGVIKTKSLQGSSADKEKLIENIVTKSELQKTTNDIKEVIKELQEIVQGEDSDSLSVRIGNLNADVSSLQHEVTRIKNFLKAFTNYYDGEFDGVTVEDNPFDNSGINFDFEGNVDFSGNVSFDSNVDFSGNVSFDSNVDFSGNISFEGEALDRFNYYKALA